MGRPALDLALVLNPESAHPTYHAPGGGIGRTFCGVKVPDEFILRAESGAKVSYPSVLRQEHADAFAAPCGKCYEPNGKQ